MKGSLRPLIDPAAQNRKVHEGLLKRDSHEQLLEPAPLLGLIAAPGADTVENNAPARPSHEIEARADRALGDAHPHGADDESTMAGMGLEVADAMSSRQAEEIPV